MTANRSFSAVVQTVGKCEQKASKFFTHMIGIGSIEQKYRIVRNGPINGGPLMTAQPMNRQFGKLCLMSHLEREQSYTKSALEGFNGAPKD